MPSCIHINVNFRLYHGGQLLVIAADDKCHRESESVDQDAGSWRSRGQVQSKAEDDSFTTHGRPAGAVKLPANTKLRIEKKSIKNSEVMDRLER